MASKKTLWLRMRAIVDDMQWQGWNIASIDRRARARMLTDIDENGFTRVPWSRFEAELREGGITQPKLLEALRVRYIEFFQRG